LIAFWSQLNRAIELYKIKINTHTAEAGQNGQKPERFYKEE